MNKNVILISVHKAGTSSLDNRIEHQGEEVAPNPIQYYFNFNVVNNKVK